MYETYGMSAIEAAGYGIPTVHVDTPHVREGIGDAAVLVSPLSVSETNNGINLIENNYELYSEKARQRAEWLHVRQAVELERFSKFIENVTRPTNITQRQNSVARASRVNRHAS
jgi:hypothetical protein